MTDSTDDEDRDTEGTLIPQVDSQVPEDTDWELEVQVPFNEGEKHDLTTAVIYGVAEAEGVSPMDIKEPPLYEIVYTSALEEAFFGPSTIDQDCDDYRSVEFMYRGHRIVIRSDAWVQIYAVLGG